MSSRFSAATTNRGVNVDISTRDAVAVAVEEQRLLAIEKMKAILDGAVVSKFIMQRECLAYRQAVKDCMEVMRQGSDGDEGNG